MNQQLSYLDILDNLTAHQFQCHGAGVLRFVRTGEPLTEPCAVCASLLRQLEQARALVTTP